MAVGQSISRIFPSGNDIHGLIACSPIAEFAHDTERDELFRMRDVYLLQSGYFLDQYCVGVTSGLKQRLAEHNAPSADSNGFFAILACK